MAAGRRPLLADAVGALVLVVYGIIPTLQESNDRSRIYAAYGGVFMIGLLLWGRAIDGKQPDRYDWAGAVIVAAGVAIIYFPPRPAALSERRAWSAEADAL